MRRRELLRRRPLVLLPDVPLLEAPPAPVLGPVPVLLPEPAPAPEELPAVPAPVWASETPPVPSRRLAASSAAALMCLVIFVSPSAVPPVVRDTGCTPWAAHVAMLLLPQEEKKLNQVSINNCF